MTCLKVGLNRPKWNQISELVAALTLRRTCAVYRLDAGSVGTISWESWRLPFWPAERRGAEHHGWLRNTPRSDRQSDACEGGTKKRDTEALKPSLLNVWCLRHCYLPPHLCCTDNRRPGGIYFKKLSTCENTRLKCSGGDLWGRLHWNSQVGYKHLKSTHSLLE